MPPAAQSLAARASAPLLIAVACFWLSGHIVARPEMVAALPGYGPTFWPTAMLAAAGLCALLWLGLELWRSRSHPEAVEELLHPVEAEPYDRTRAVLGIALTLVYGFAIVFLGFPLATLLFVALWCILGRVRSPLTIVLVAVIGTLALCYIFVLIARMPLDRGVEPFGSFTIALYQLLGIY